MQLEFHQLDRRWEHLRVHHPARQRRLLASLPVASPLDCSWDELSKALRTMWAQTTAGSGTWRDRV